MKNIFFIILLFFAINGCGMVIPIIMPFNDLPAPTGRFNVGTQIYEWEDQSREEWFTEQEGDYRRLVVQVWYPSQKSNKIKANYLDFPGKRVEPLSRRIELPEYFFKHIKNVKSNSIYDIPIYDKSKLYPLILFSHGLGGMRMQNTIQLEELASHGYIVIAMDHTYDANVTVFLDGSTAEFRSALNEDASEEEVWKVRLPQLNTRAMDLTFIIDEITKLKENSNTIWSNIDLTKIGVFGHSFGGATAVVTSYNDNRIDACINLDGWMEPIESNIIKEGIDVPFLYIGQERWINTPLNDIKLDSLIASSAGIKVLLEGSKHFDFSDTPQFNSMSKIFGISGSMDPKDVKNKMNFEIVEFFKKQLN